MKDFGEIVITTDGNGQSGTARVWNLRTGTLIFTMQGGGISPSRNLCLLGEDYLLSSEQSKPIIHAWPVNSHEPSSDLRSVCAGIVNALSASPNGLWVAVAVEDKVHVLQAASGCLLGVVSGHYQNVSVLRFTDDSTHLISAGDDGMVLVWSIASVVDNDTGVVDPVYRLTGHHLPVKDVCVGYGGMRARMASVSIDGTCQIVDLASGKLLLKLIHDKPLTAVTFIDTDVFFGDNAGTIRAVCLRDPPRQVDHHLGKENAVFFQGHKKAVTCLATSVDGSLLVSGSADECVRIWHIKSRECVRILDHKGPITNILVTMTPKQMFENKFSRSITLKKLQRNMVQVNDEFTISVPSKKSVEFTPHLAAREIALLNDQFLKPTANVVGMPVNDTEHLNVTKLQQINGQLYDFIIEKILSNVPHEKSATEEISSKSVDIDKALKRMSGDSVKTVDKALKRMSGDSVKTKTNNVSHSTVKAPSKKKRKRS